MTESWRTHGGTSNKKLVFPIWRPWLFFPEPVFISRNNAHYLWRFNLLIPLSINEQSVMINKESSSKDVEVREDFLKLPNITFFWILRTNHIIGIPYWLPPIQVSSLFYFGAFHIQLSILEFLSFYIWVYWLHLAYALFTVYWSIEKGSP